MNASPAVDVLSMGRVGVDIYPMQVGVGLEDVSTFGKFLGGSAANVAVAAARLGRSAALVSSAGDDPFGRFVRRSLDELGVDPTHVGTHPGLPTPVTFCEIFPPDSFPLYFYRAPTAPDLTLDPDALPENDVRRAGVLWTTLTGLSVEPSRSAHLRAWEIRDRAPFAVIDLDYRPGFWDDEAAAHEAAGLALERCTVAVGNREECRIAVGESEPRRAAAALLERGVRLAIVKGGPSGSLAATEDEVVELAAPKVTTVNGLGAGDAFGGALCHGLLAGWPLPQLLAFANAAGALVASRLECSTAMPSEDEVRDLLSQASSQRPAGGQTAGTTTAGAPPTDASTSEGGA